MNAQYDVVIAGAGAGGGFAAMALAKRGLKVLLLERGRRFDFQKDYPMNHPDWELRLDPLSATPKIFDHGPMPAIKPQDRVLCSSRFENGKRITSRVKHRGKFGYGRAIGVGGSTLRYQGEAHRYPEHAFFPQSLFGWGRDWPFDYHDLRPFYDQAEKILGVAGSAANPFKNKRGPYPTPAHNLSTRSQWAKKGADRLGWLLLPNTLALPSRSVDGRTPCQYSGGCVRGCIFGAKSSVDVTAIRIAEATGNLTLIPEARVLSIDTDNQGNVSGFVYKHARKQKKAIGRKYIVAMGAIETPRLLLASQSAQHPNGIGNSHDNVGRYFMETISTTLLGAVDDPMHTYKGPPLDARIWDFSLPKAPLRSGFVLGVAGTLGARSSPASYAWSASGFGLKHKAFMRNQFGKDIQLFGIAEHIPHRDNRITLTDNKDTDGVPLVRVYSDYHVEDRRTLKAMIERIMEWADACNMDRRYALNSTYSNPGSAHVAGTCRMGVDPSYSVTNPYGRVHGLANLYIGDTSCLPTLGAGDSPSLTIQALVLRMASRI